LRDEIRQQMALDKSKEEILAHFADKYGEKILSSPTTTGFNLVAWVMPFLALSIAAAVLVLTVTRWGRRRAPVPAAPAASPPGAASEYQRILERELKQFRE
jgi:cytochrome c-type biogenesis protein CcmH